MKNQSGYLRLLSIIAFTLSGCGDNGPGFPTSMTATKLWDSTSDEFYLPSSLTGDDTLYISGTGKCGGGGTATSIDTVAGTKETVNVTYSDCINPQVTNDLSEEFKQTGTAKFSFEQTEPGSSVVGNYTYVQQIEYSGDFNFTANCDFKLHITSNETFTPETYYFDKNDSCTYTDSNGQQLKITGTEMTAVLHSH